MFQCLVVTYVFSCYALLFATLNIPVPWFWQKVTCTCWVRKKKNKKKKNSQSLDIWSHLRNSLILDCDRISFIHDIMAKHCGFLSWRFCWYKMFALRDVKNHKSKIQKYGVIPTSSLGFARTNQHLSKYYVFL